MALAGVFSFTIADNWDCDGTFCLNTTMLIVSDYVFRAGKHSKHNVHHTLFSRAMLTTVR
jgi:hypothetical protein